MIFFELFFIDDLKLFLHFPSNSWIRANPKLSLDGFICFSSSILVALFDDNKDEFFTLV